MKFYTWLEQQIERSDGVGSMAFLICLYAAAIGEESLNQKTKDELLLGIEYNWFDEELKNDFDNLWEEWEQQT